MTTRSRKTSTTKTTTQTSSSETGSPAKTPPSTAPTPTVTQPELKKRELIEALTAQTGLKRRDVRHVAEAMLATLGKALADGRSLNLPPMGKLRIRRSEGREQGQMLTCKMRLMNPAEKDAAAPLAEPVEQG
ncbi:MAG: HU family DNA-binding protein [Pseudomonadota bacterium]